MFSNTFLRYLVAEGTRLIQHILHNMSEVPIVPGDHPPIEVEYGTAVRIINLLRTMVATVQNAEFEDDDPLMMWDGEELP